MPRKQPDLAKAAYKGFRPAILEWAHDLKRGAQRPPPAVRDLMLLASHPATTRPVLDFLLKAEDVSVRVALAANPCLPRAHFLALLADHEPDVVEAALYNQCVPYDLLQATAERHPSPTAREMAQSILAEFTAGKPI